MSGQLELSAATTVRDTARRCSRCGRVTLGVRPLWLHEGRDVVDVLLACGRCRDELKTVLVKTLQAARR